MKTRLFSIAAAAVAVALTFTAAPRAEAQVEPYIGQAMLFGGNFCPRGWVKADGQLLAINTHDALFSLFSTIYGGDGRTTFGVPDLRGRVPINAGTGPGLSPYREGQKGGAEQFTLTTNNLPSHTHTLRAHSEESNSQAPGGHLLGPSPDLIYSSESADVSMAATALTNTGNQQAIRVQSPYLALFWCVATVGLYPSRN